MSQVGSAEEIWTHLSKMFPEMPSERREASDDFLHTSPCLASCFSSKGRPTDVSSPLLTPLLFATFQEKQAVNFLVSLQTPAEQSNGSVRPVISQHQKKALLMGTQTPY